LVLIIASIFFGLALLFYNPNPVNSKKKAGGPKPPGNKT